MPSETSFETVPIGHVVEAVRNATSVKVCTAAFLSSEDGQELIKGLEGFPNDLLSRVSPDRRVSPSQVDHMLAIIRRDHTATIYVNELQFVAGVVVGKSIKKGEYVWKNDIVDIATMEFDGIRIPDDAGVIVVFSVGWRKGYFYDLLPLYTNEDNRRATPFPEIFGHCFSRVLFQERFSILDSQWESLIKSKWFPFAALKNETLDKMIAHLRAGWDLDDLTSAIATEVKERLPNFIEAWRNHPAFANHLKVLEKAAEHFVNADYLSASALLFPRIEGLLRSKHALVSSNEQQSQSNLSSTAVEAQSDRPACLLLPQKFEQYLREVYFASFRPEDQQIGVSRNSVGHGVVNENELNEKAAVIGLLVVQQLLYSFGRHRDTPVQTVAVLPTNHQPPKSSQAAAAK